MVSPTCFLHNFLYSSCTFDLYVLGIVTILFFKCMGALFDPLNRTRKGVKWGLAVHAAAMFSFATVYIATSLEIHSTAYIDNREFSSVEGLFPPGPTGYKSFVYSKPTTIVTNAAFLLGDWQADGLLVSLASGLIVPAYNTGYSPSSTVVL